MKIVVLAKHAFLSSIRPRINDDAKGFQTQDLISEMNDWDRYALEEAIKLKEQKGAEILVISVGKDCDQTLRTCLAMGADKAIKIPIDSTDAWQIAEAISEVIKAEKYDLILAGFQSQDLNNGLVGPILAGLLDLPYATAVSSVRFEDDGINITRELESGFEEEDTISLPCLLTVQTGINLPRYASMKGILKAKSKEIGEVIVMAKPSTFEIKKFYFPITKKGKMIEGSPEEVSAKLVEIFKEREVI